MADQKEKTVNFNLEGLVWENKNRIVALEGNVSYIRESINNINKTLTDLNVKIDNHFASKEYVDGKVALLAQEFRPTSNGVIKVVEYLVLGLVGAIIAVLLDLKSKL